MLGSLLAKTLGATTDDAKQREYWEAESSHRAADHPIPVGFAQQRWQFLRQLLALHEVQNALDVGCGSGFSTCQAPAHIDVVGCDGAVNMLRRNRASQRVQANALQLPFADDAFDLVFCWELLHHVEDPAQALREMARVSRRWVLFFEPNPLNAAQAAFALVDREHRWVLRYRRSYVLDQVRRAGLEPVRFVRGGLIFPNKTPMWMYSVLRRLPYRIPLIGISVIVLAEKR